MAAPKEWNFTLYDTSPLFHYRPLSDGSNTSTGWQSVYDDKANVSYHITCMPNASISLSFFGTGITLYGTSNVSFVAYFDKQNASLPSNQERILYQSNGAKLDTHEIQLEMQSVDEAQEFRFDKAVVTSQVVGKQLSPEVVEHGSDAKLMKTRGSWHTKNSSNRFSLSPQSNTTVRATKRPGDTISFSFNGRAVAIYGPVNASSGLFSVSHNDDVHLVNASSQIQIDETVLYYEDGLDESNTTTISLTNLGDGQTTFCMSRAEVISFNSTNATSSAWASSTSNNQRETHIGAIIGPIVGITIIVATICGIMMMKRKRRKGSSVGGTVTPFEIDHEGMDTNMIGKSSKEQLPGPNANEPANIRQDTPGVGTVAPAAVSSTSLSTVERLLQLIARQVDAAGRPEGQAAGEQDRSLPPYPESVRGRSFRSVN